MAVTTLVDEDIILERSVAIPILDGVMTTPICGVRH
jgi:hypothetical protein